MIATTAEAMGAEPRLSAERVTARPRSRKLLSLLERRR
jgi:hypothetical protein